MKLLLFSFFLLSPQLCLAGWRDRISNDCAAEIGLGGALLSQVGLEIYVHETVAIVLQKVNAAKDSAFLAQANMELSLNKAQALKMGFTQAELTQIHSDAATDLLHATADPTLESLVRYLVGLQSDVSGYYSRNITPAYKGHNLITELIVRIVVPI